MHFAAIITVLAVTAAAAPLSSFAALVETGAALGKQHILLIRYIPGCMTKLTVVSK
jgi:hypothetical protein